MAGVQLPSAEDVEFWVAPEKAGWLQSQGDHIKTWRRRWFVLKQGYLFRFASPDVTSASKPRGLVDLSKASAPACACFLLAIAKPDDALCTGLGTHTGACTTPAWGDLLLNGPPWQVLQIGCSPSIVGASRGATTASHALHPV